MTIRHRPSRRTAIRTIGIAGIASLGLTGAAGARADSSATRTGCEDNDGTGDSTEENTADGATRYVAVVDRIVDGEHVVLLLERNGELVDQLVVSGDGFDHIAEGDLLIVDVKDGELLDYGPIDERPPDGV